jgi:hypothetical protein
MLEIETAETDVRIMGGYSMERGGISRKESEVSNVNYEIVQL